MFESNRSIGITEGVQITKTECYQEEIRRRMVHGPSRWPKTAIIDMLPWAGTIVDR